MKKSNLSNLTQHNLLESRLKSANLKEFKLEALFTIKSNPQLNKDSFTFNESGKYPYFTRTVANNGISGYVDYLNESHKISGNCLAVGMLGMQFFYMNNDFYAGQFTKRAIPKGFTLNEKIAKYLTTILNKNQREFQSCLVRDFVGTFYRTKIMLPAKNGKIDFDFIEQLITDIENENINSLVSFLSSKNT